MSASRRRTVVQRRAAGGASVGESGPYAGLPTQAARQLRQFRIALDFKYLDAISRLAGRVRTDPPGPKRPRSGEPPVDCTQDGFFAAGGRRPPGTGRAAAHAAADA